MTNYNLYNTRGVYEKISDNYSKHLCRHFYLNKTQAVSYSSDKLPAIRVDQSGAIRNLNLYTLVQ